MDEFYFLSFQHLVNLFARLANDNIGYIDWDPYIPKVHCFIVLFFVHCLRLFTSLLGWILSFSFEAFTFNPSLEIWACGVCFIDWLRNKISAYLVDVSKGKSLVYVSAGWLLEPCYLKIQLCATGENKHVSLSIGINNMLQWRSSQCCILMGWLFFFVPLQIFTRILRSLNLPVGTSQMMVPRYITNAYDISHVVLWVSSLLVCVLPVTFVCVRYLT